VAGVVGLIGGRQQRVERGQARDPGHRHQVTAAEAPDLALHTALFMGTVDPGLTEEGVESEVRAQRDEALALDALASDEHARDSRLEVVVADAAGRTTEVIEGHDVALQERLLALARVADVHGLPGVGESHHEHRQLREHATQPDADLAEVDLCLRSRRMQLWHRHERRPRLELAPHHRDVPTHRRLGHAGSQLVDEALPDPPRRVTLLAWRTQVGDQPRADRRLVRIELRGRPLRSSPGWRDRRGQRLANCSSVHAMATGQATHRQHPIPMVSADTLEQLHPRHSSSFAAGKSDNSTERRHWIGRGWGQFRPSLRF
jgi:hypothetical protein